MVLKNNRGVVATAFTAPGMYTWEADEIGGATDSILKLNAYAKLLTTANRGGVLNLAVTRTAGDAMTGWDGNADEGLKIVVRNNTTNTTSRQAVRGLNVQARNDGSDVWVKTFELNARNSVTGSTTELNPMHLRAENYGSVSSTIIGLDVEMSSENDTGSPVKTAVLIRNTDLSGMTAVRDVFKVSHTSTNGFTNLFYFNGTTGDTTAAGSLKDSSGVNIECDAYAVCSINGTPYYLPLYDTLN